MANIVLVLALVEKPMKIGAWLKMLMMLLHGTINLIKKGIRQQIHDQENGE